MLTGQGRANDFLLLGQAAPLSFFSLSSLPLPSRFLSRPIPCFRSRPPLLFFPIFHSLPFTCISPMSKTITTTTLRQGSEMVVCKMWLRVKNALLHKLSFVQPPYFNTPWCGFDPGTSWSRVQSGVLTPNAHLNAICSTHILSRWIAVLIAVNAVPSRSSRLAVYLRFSVVLWGCIELRL